MKNATINLEKYIEHTILKPDARLEDIKKILNEAVNYKFLGVCINPIYVLFAKEYLEEKNIKIVTVIGFPLGASLTSIKAAETQNAIEDGADEIDMVIDIGAVKDKNFSRAENDIRKVVKKAENNPVKVILETDLLTRDEIIEASKISANAGAKFVKTSTGFVKGGIGATVENVRLMHKIVSPYNLQVKASGGIKNRESAIALLEAGASRLGTSSGVELILV